MHNPIPRMHPFLFRENSHARISNWNVRVLSPYVSPDERVSFDAEDEDACDDERVMERVRWNASTRDDGGMKKVYNCDHSEL